VRTAPGSRTFSRAPPSVAIGVQRNTVDSQAKTALVKLRGAVAAANGVKVGEQRAGCRHLPQEGFNVRSKMNHGKTAGFLPVVSDGLVGPVNVLRLEIGDVRLRTAEMPAQFVEAAPLRVLFPPDDELMFFAGDGTPFLEAHFWPETLGNDRPRQPVHGKAEVVEFPKVNIRADRARLEAGEQMLCLCFENDAMANQVQRGLLGCLPPPILGCTVFGLDDGVKGLLPCPGRDA